MRKLLRLLAFLVVLPLVIPIGLVVTVGASIVLVAITAISLGTYAFEGTWENPWTEFTNMIDE